MLGAWAGLMSAGAAACALAGCDRTPVNPEALRQQVLQADSGFAETLAKRDELAGRIKVLERELDLKRTQIDRQIDQLREEMKDTADRAAQRIDAIKALNTPELERLDQIFAQRQDELKEKRRHRDKVAKTISQIRKDLKAGPADRTESERARLDRELADHLREIQRVDQEIAAIDGHLRLVKSKRFLLRL